MGQTNARRGQFKPRETITSSVNDDVQTMARTCLFEKSDTVDVIDVDANGNILSVLANNLTILAINPDISVVLSSAVDTSAAVGTPMLRNQSIQNIQFALERLYCRKFTGAIDFPITQDILAQSLNDPIGGQATYDVDDISFLKSGAGQLVDILADEGIVAIGVTIISVAPKADDANNRAIIVTSPSTDTSAFTNPFIVTTNLTVRQAILGLQEDIDTIDKPFLNRDLAPLLGDGVNTAFENEALFVQGTSQYMIDGNRKKLGTAGTRAALIQGAGDAELTFTSMLLGLYGNEVRVEVVAGAGFTIAVVQNFASLGNGSLAPSDTLIQINDNTGAATSEEIADNLNAHATVKRIVLVQWGGDGTGVVAPFGPTALAGGLDNGIGDYAELEQIFENEILSTGFKWLSLHIRPDEILRMDAPPEDDEENYIDYKRALVNIDR